MKQKLQEAVLAAKNGREEDARVLLAQFLRDEPENVPGWVLLSKLATSDAQQAAFLRKVLDLEPDHAYARRALASLEERSRPEAETRPETGPMPQAGEPEERDRAEEAGGVAQETTAEPTGSHEEEVPAEGAGAGPDPFSFEEEDLEGDLTEEELAAALEESDTEPTLSDADAPRDFEAQMQGDTLPPWLPEDDVELPSATPDDLEEDEEDLFPEWLGEQAGAQGPGEQDEARAVEAPLEEEPLPEWLAEEADEEWLDQEDEGRRVAEQEAELAEAMERPPQQSEWRSPWRTMALLAVAILLFLLLAYAALSFL